ncbi:response regulator [Fodinicurvata fenggangensis]|uniref:response regulator n=1 Tax=Fodinicurvata fenggangensis TaxID=1121830 RepID=UPI000691C187|nr:response regulator [Fodinicurvata fenggangensis]
MATLLLADNEKTFRQELAVALEGAGYVVLQAGSGEEALAVYHSNSVQTVITSILMPDRDGIEVIREILGLEWSTRVIAMSSGCALCGLDIGKLALRSGAERVLEKPFTAEALLQELTEILVSGSTFRVPREEVGDAA